MCGLKANGCSECSRYTLKLSGFICEVRQFLCHLTAFFLDTVASLRQLIGRLAHLLALQFC